MDWATRYLLGAFAVVGLALWSGDFGKVLLSLTLLIAWANENLWFEAFGQANAWIPIALTDIAFAAVTTVIGLEYHVNRTAAALVALYAAREALQVVAIFGIKHGYVFYAGLNILYGLQLLVIAGGAIHGLASVRFNRGDGWLRLDGWHVLPLGPREGLPKAAKQALERLLSRGRGHG